MNRFIPLNKQTKKQQKKHYSTQRSDWGTISPVTRIVNNGKAYNRAKAKQDRDMRLEEAF